MSESNCWSVYVLTAPNGKVYVGATSRPPAKRWSYGNGYEQNKPFFTDIKMFGWKNITRKVVASGLSRDSAYALETELIAAYDSTKPENGYNRSTGGAGASGVKISPQTRQRQIESHVGKKLPHTPEWNKNIAEGNRGKRKPHDGVPRSKECKAKISTAHSRAVVQYTRDMVFVKMFPSAKDAAKETGVHPSSISACCHGKRNSCYGYIWKFY